MPFSHTESVTFSPSVIIKVGKQAFILMITYESPITKARTYQSANRKLRITRLYIPRTSPKRLTDPTREIVMMWFLRILLSMETFDKDTLIALKQELQSLNKEDYTIINSHYMKDLTQSEIANELGMNQVQVSRKEKKILVKLKDKLIA